MKLSDFQNAVKAQLNNPPGHRSLGHAFLRGLGDNIYKKCLGLSKKHNVSVQEVAFRLTFKPPLCATCQENPTKRKSSAKAGFYKYCSPTCAQLDPKVRDKFERTMKKRHGVAYTAQSPKLVKKMMNTTAEKYGSVKKAYKARLEKTRLTMLERYGVEHFAHDRTHYEKLAYNIKEFTLAGKTFRVRGFEPAAIKWLHLERGIPVKHIKTTALEGLPTLQYKTAGQVRVYHPDILVRNLEGRWGLVEVKSSYTSGLLKDDGQWENLKAKARAVLRSGYHFKVLLVLGKREGVQQLVVPLSDVHKMTRTEARSKVEAHRRKLGLLHAHKLDDLRTKSCGSP